MRATHVTAKHARASNLTQSMAQCTSNSPNIRLVLVHCRGHRVDRVLDHKNSGPKISAKRRFNANPVLRQGRACARGGGGTSLLDQKTIHCQFHNVCTLRRLTCQFMRHRSCARGWNRRRSAQVLAEAKAIYPSPPSPHGVVKQGPSPVHTVCLPIGNAKMT